MIDQLKFVWARFVCAVKQHTFTQDEFGIVYCERCNWYGGPATMAALMDEVMKPYDL